MYASSRFPPSPAAPAPVSAPFGALATRTPPSAAPAPLSLINLAARQRMLSQRMILQTVLAAGGKPGSLEAARKSFELFCSSHQQLVKSADGMEPTHATRVRQTYNGQGGVGPTIMAFMNQMRTTLTHIEAQDRLVESSLNALVACTDAILEALNTATTTFDAIAKSKEDQLMKELTGIVTNIQTVAREAKVVSFNAQVIAARAGEHGRGFAVVANVLSGIAADIDQQAKTAMDLTVRNRAASA